MKELSYRIIGAFFDVYNELGFGYLESVYVAAMAVALARAGLRVEREVPAYSFTLVQRRSFTAFCDLPKAKSSRDESLAGIRMNSDDSEAFG